jgi:predicted TIM-barrel fold metal-dependent hydrolase
VALAAAAQHPDRLAIMVRLNLKAPGARSQLASWRKQPGMLGLRFTTKDFFTDWLWAEAEAAGVPIMMGSTELAAQVSARHPKLRLVIDHLAIQLGTHDDDSFADLDKLLALAKRPNVAVKASSLPKYSTHAYPYRNFHRYVRRAYDAFGPRRMFFGSDFTGQPCTYRQTITMFTEEMDWLTSEDKEWIMGQGIREWLGW